MSVTHGTRTRYVYGCRCDDCRAAHRVYMGEYGRRTREKIRARRATYATCEVCFKPVDGSNGRTKAPKKCRECFYAARAAKHGTRSKYTAGCRCDDCQRANTEYHREYMRRRRAAA